MGLNIILKRIINITHEETWGGKLEPYYHTVRLDWFDSLRYVGDKEFAYENKFLSLDIDGDYNRPEDIDKTICWVKDNISPNNQARLLKALEEMKVDENVQFVFSR